MRVKELLKQKGMTAKELASKIGISEGALSQSIKEGANPNLQTISKIATALNVPISALFEAERDFIAFVRRNGETLTFESEAALKAYADTLSVPADTERAVSGK
jgi:transcriptional regulator with XRE-family HTH domain